jgi:enoyl-CoA hydratase/carnithine racemase
LQHDEDLRAVVVLLRGLVAASGRGASRGRNAAERCERASNVDGVAAIASLRVPVIAALRGAIADESLELALACDLRVAAADARLSLAQVRGGELPVHGGTQRLPRIVGRGPALRMLLLGEPFGARAAERLGLVSQVVEPSGVKEAALALARRLAERGPIAQRLAKEALAAAFDLPLAEGLRLEGDLYVLLQTTRDRDEGIASFRDERAPVFRGR